MMFRSIVPLLLVLGYSSGLSEAKSTRNAAKQLLRKLELTCEGRDEILKEYQYEIELVVPAPTVSTCDETAIDAAVAVSMEEVDTLLPEIVIAVTGASQAEAVTDEVALVNPNANAGSFTFTWKSKSTCKSCSRDNSDAYTPAVEEDIAAAFKEEEQELARAHQEELKDLKLMWKDIKAESDGIQETFLATKKELKASFAKADKEEKKVLKEEWQAAHEANKEERAAFWKANKETVVGLKEEYVALVARQKEEQAALQKAEADINPTGFAASAIQDPTDLITQRFESELTVVLVAALEETSCYSIPVSDVTVEATLV